MLYDKAVRAYMNLFSFSKRILTRHVYLVSPLPSKMPYVTDGSVHHAGVRNEHAIAEAFTLSPPPVLQAAYPGQTLTFVHRGGTHEVDDIAVYSDGVRIAGVSTKLHGSSGTFDYINTSRIMAFLPEAASAVERIAEIGRMYMGVVDAVPIVRREVAAAIDTLWGGMSDASIRRLLQAVDGRNSEWVAINEFVTHHNNLVELHVHPHDPDTVYELRAVRAAGSRQIWRVKNGIAENTHLRVRIVLNNGCNALIGLSRANKNSYLSIKIQQDNVNGLLASLA